MKSKKLIIIIIVSILLFGGIAYAAGSTPIQAYITDIKLYLNGNPVDKEIITIDGTSYLPVRAISEALGLEVEWVSNTRTIKLKSSAGLADDKEEINLNGKWTTSSGIILQLQQNNNSVTGSLIFQEDWDETRWPTPVKGKIEGNILTLDIKHDNESIVRKIYGLPDDHLFLFSVIQEGIYDRLVLEINDDILSGTLQYAKIWYSVNIFPNLDKIENGGSSINTNELKDVTFLKE